MHSVRIPPPPTCTWRNRVSKYKFKQLDSHQLVYPAPSLDSSFIGAVSLLRFLRCLSFFFFKQHGRRQHRVRVEGEMQRSQKEHCRKNVPSARYKLVAVHLERNGCTVNRCDDAAECSGFAINFVPADNEEHGEHEHQKPTSKLDCWKCFRCCWTIEKSFQRTCICVPTTIESDRQSVWWVEMLDVFSSCSRVRSIQLKLSRKMCNLP